MELTPELQNAFDEELAYLKGFNDTYLQETLDFFLEQEDSPIKSVLQAIALLSARTQVSAKEHLSLLHQRLIKQMVSYLISPVPAMALVQANTEHLIEPITVEAGTDLQFANQLGDEARFRCLFDTPLQAIRLVNTGLAKRAGFGCEVVLQLEALSDYPGRLNELKMCIFAHGSYWSAVRVKALLEEHSLGCQASFDGAEPVALTVEHDLHEASPARKSLHPIIRQRYFFHMPHQNAFIQLNCEKAPEQWQQCRIVFRLDCEWPDALLVNQDLFKLFVIPVENRQAEQTDPVFFQGTRTGFSVRPPDSFPELRLASVCGVYHLQDGEHKPLFSAMIHEGSGTYEIAYPQLTNTRTDQLPRLMVNMPEAFDEPVKLILDGYWHNPGFSKAMNDQLSIFPTDVEINGVSWTALGIGGKKFIPFTPPATTLSEQLLDLAALKNKAILSLPELLFIVRSLSTVWRGEFKILQPLIKSLHVKHQVMKKRVDLQAMNDKPTLYYLLGFKQFEESFLPLINEFTKHLEIILQHWISHHRIEVIAEIAGVEYSEREARILDRGSEEFVVVEPEVSGAL